MKLFYTKKEYNELKQIVDNQTNAIGILTKKIKDKEFKYLKEKSELQDGYNNILDIYTDLKHKYKKMIGRCAGLTKENNKLKKNMENKNEK